MSKNYVDFKCTIWQRMHFKDNADMQKVIEILKKENYPGHLDLEELGFQENEILFDTEEFLLPEENDNQSTVEVYSQNKEETLNYQDMIWDNSKNN